MIEVLLDDLILPPSGDDERMNSLEDQSTPCNEIPFDCNTTDDNLISTLLENATELDQDIHLFGKYGADSIRFDNNDDESECNSAITVTTDGLEYKITNDSEDDALVDDCRLSPHFMLEDDDDHNSDTDEWETESEEDISDSKNDDQQDVCKSQIELPVFPLVRSTKNPLPPGDEPDECLFIRDFPVQVVLTEKCQNTLSDLMVYLQTHRKNADEQMQSALMQIICSLVIYQKAFAFTHNDLHDANIMFIPTTEKFLYYKINGGFYRVPTYGRIFKIIDFGRSIYHFCGDIFMSDNFSKNGDAYSQYNFGPFFDESLPELTENFSFDMCRLGLSLFLFYGLQHKCFGSATKCGKQPAKLTPFEGYVKQLCEDDMGKNILYKNNGKKRYTGFKTYKMVSRLVHHHTPLDELMHPFFQSVFRINDELAAKHDFLIQKTMMDIDSIPVLTNPLGL